MNVRSLWPRRAADLPPGQREIREFPRFSDKPQLCIVCLAAKSLSSRWRLLAIVSDFRKDKPASSVGPKEHLRARVALEERHATLPNWLLRIPYRLTIVPTALAAERGLRKSPN